MWNRNNLVLERNRRRCDCDCVFDCLEELLEGAFEEDNCNRNRNRCCSDNDDVCDERDNDDVRGEENRRDCDCVFDCLKELLECRNEERNRRNRCCFR